VILAAVSLILLLGVGGLGVRYRTEQRDAQARMDDLRTELDQARAELAGVQRDLQQAQEGAQACMSAIQAFLDVSLAGGEVDEDEVRDLLLVLINECEITVELP
jgi:hypothetical protein